MGNGLVVSATVTYRTNVAIVVDVNSVLKDAEKLKRCDYCYSNWQWTMPAFNKHEVLQIGCHRCHSIYNVVEEEYLLIGQRHKHFIFWKDLTRQWNEALKVIHAASSAKKME